MRPWLSGTHGDRVEALTSEDSTMWILLALVCMVLALKTFSFSFTLALIPFALGCLCFSQSDRESLDNFMAFGFMLILIGFVVLIVISFW